MTRKTAFLFDEVAHVEKMRSGVEAESRSLRAAISGREMGRYAHGQHDDSVFVHAVRLTQLTGEIAADGDNRRRPGERPPRESPAEGRPGVAVDVRTMGEDHERA